MHTRDIQSAGLPLTKAKKVLILLHGRGASSADILSLAPYLNVPDYALLAPQATNHSWYPYSFMAPPEKNEPWLSSALQIIKDLVEEIQAQGISAENIYFLGFSQGACLTLEFVARNAQHFGGVVAFTGGLIGDKIYAEKYQGDFGHTPIFISIGNPDPHVPVSRVEETARLLRSMHASVTVEIYDNRPHIITEEEIERVNEIVFK